jgi:serine protease Do
LPSEANGIKIKLAMVGKLKYIILFLAIVALILPGIGGCTTLESFTPTSSNGATQTANPNWTFPVVDNQSNFSCVCLPDYTPIVNKVKPAVVSVTTEVAKGSGFLIDGEQGYIATNDHVVDNAQNIRVTLDDGETLPAMIVGKDALTDLAVVKIDATGLPYISFGNSSSLTVGQSVLAIGNAFGLGLRVSQGIISGLNVTITLSSGEKLYNLIETTAAINPGNSGGPLVNMKGEVIGITSAKILGAENMGYAISSDSARPIIEELIHRGYIIRPWLGVYLQTLDWLTILANNLPVDKGVLIVKVVPDSPAEVAGLKEGDIIIKFQDSEIETAQALQHAILECQIGQEVKITFVRGRDTKTTYAVLAQSLPPES